MVEQHVPNEGPLIVEPQEPVGNLWEKFNRYFYARGQVTREARFGHAPEQPEGIAYPLFARARRARYMSRFLTGAAKAVLTMISRSIWMRRTNWMRY